MDDLGLSAVAHLGEKFVIHKPSAPRPLKQPGQGTAPDRVLAGQLPGDPQASSPASRRAAASSGGPWLHRPSAPHDATCTPSVCRRRLTVPDWLQTRR